MPIKSKVTNTKKPSAESMTASEMTTKKRATVKTTTGDKKLHTKTATKKKLAKEEAKSPLLDEEHINQDAAGPAAIISPYEAKPGEEYMNDRQLQHFTKVLLAWRHDLLKGVDKTVDRLKEDAENYADLADRATQEEEFNMELRTRDRERKLLKKIENARQRINDGDFGYCAVCGVGIGLARLEVRPTATLCIDCKTVEEIREKQIIL